ncbi:hypothetical protein TraAM80_02134 [Trypanosoma rangeli]|uniref:Rieske domain-containing protein n=1 Tax=Trypanosoma rangeli TaxID=5698 RepID=A0A422NVN8_TRYRA|nr:uncharacterized protein TraAM80_02134 [Trypanosoma rangeli]RNF09525.1 hypothetical protein TraAM80_02134 [Trypanosoma rangeli]|eukprot:RNF09525.1 hypothetical protein TraAM80_02134 [Trypanosoma rangeli]
MYDGWSYERLRQQRNRAHFLLEDPHRFVTVLLHNGKLYAIDSPCYHASGPLGEGELMDVEDAHMASSVVCLRCPWHNVLVAIETGELVEVQPISPVVTVATEDEEKFKVPSYPLRPHWEASGGRVRLTRGPVVQRTHKVSLEEATGIMTIEVEDEAEIRRHPLPSDAVAGNLQSGAVTMQIFDIKLRCLS